MEKKKQTKKKRNKKAKRVCLKFIDKHKKIRETKHLDQLWKKTSIVSSWSWSHSPIDNCSLSIRHKVNINHKQLAANTGYAAIHYCNPGVSIASSLLQQNQLAATNNFITSFALIFWMATEEMVFLHLVLTFVTAPKIQIHSNFDGCTSQFFLVSLSERFLDVLLCKILESRWVFFKKVFIATCLVPRPHYSAQPKRFGSRGPSENVRPRQKSSKARKKWDSSKQVNNTPLKDTDWKGKFKRMLSFLLVDKGRLFFTKLSFEEFEIHEISIIGALGLFRDATKRRSFWRIFRYILYSIVEKIKFLKGELCICKYLILDVLYILRSAWAPWFEICVE